MSLIALLGYADATQSTAIIGAGVIGVPTTISITILDDEGNATDGSDTLTGNVTGVNTATLTITHVSGGVYTTTYTPAAGGTDTIVIKVNGVAISGSPFTQVIASIIGGLGARPLTSALWTPYSQATTVPALRTDLNTFMSQSMLAVNENPASAERFIDEVIPLSTSGTTTDSVQFLLPGDCIINQVTTMVTTSIATATAFSVGDATTPARFSAMLGGLTRGNARVCLDHYDGTVRRAQATNAKVRITTTGTPTAGAVVVRIYFTRIEMPSLN